MNKISTSMEDHKIICINVVAPLNWPAYKQDRSCLKLVDSPAFHSKKKTSWSLRLQKRRNERIKDTQAN